MKNFLRSGRLGAFTPVLTVLAGVMLLCSSTAFAEDINSSFTGPYTFLFTTHVIGSPVTVSGTIYGPVDNSISAPSSISAPDFSSGSSSTAVFNGLMEHLMS